MPNKEYWKAELKSIGNSHSWKMYDQTPNTVVAYLRRTDWVCKILEGSKFVDLVSSLKTISGLPVPGLK